MNLASIRKPLEKTFILQGMNLRVDGFFSTLGDQKDNKLKTNFINLSKESKLIFLSFDWFHAYTVKENIDYPWQHNLIGDPTTNVITNWQIKDGEVIQLELPPTT